NDGYEIGQPINGFIYASFGGNSGNGYSLYIEYEVFINDIGQGKITNCLFNGVRIPSGSIETIGSFTWNYGDKIEIKNYYMDWLTNNSTRTCEPASRNSQCFSAPFGFIVRTPLVANFSYLQSCSDYTVQFTNLTTGGNTNNYSYNWNFGGIGSSTQANPSFAFPAPGAYEYEVRLTSNDGSVLSSYSETIIINDLILASISDDNGLDLSCTVTSTTLTASGGVSYLWSNGATTPSITVTTADTFTVTVTGENGCTANASVTTTLDNSVPVAAISDNNGLDLSCSVPSTTLTASGGVSYLWSNGATTASITVTTADTFTVTVTGENGCTATASVT